MSHSIYLLDPDLNGVEFYIDAVSDWRAFYKSKDHALISARWDPLAAPPLPELPDAAPTEFDHVASAPFHAREIRGATLAVKDLARAVTFYRDVAGLAVQTPDPILNVALLSVPGAKDACLALVVAQDGGATGLKSLWFSVQPTSPVLAGGGPVGLIRKADAGGRLERLDMRDPDGTALLFFVDALPKTPTPDAVLMTVQ